VLRAELTAALSGHGRLVLLGGEAGIGKTSLARDLASEATAHGAYVLPGHCYDLSNAPAYGPWRDLFAGYSPGAPLPAPPAAFAGGRLERVTDRAALFAEVRRFLSNLAAARPTALVLEDLHWADPASVELLGSLAPHVRQWPLLVLATYRADELTRGHPFALQLPALAHVADGVRLDLRRLDAGGLRALVTSRYALTDVDAERLVAYLDRHAEGNPFFATEVLRALEEEGLLRSCDGGWSLGELDRLVVPPLLGQVIDGRIARLGEETRQPLAIAAVIGHEVPLDLWAAVANLDDETLLAIVERAVEAHLMDAVRDGTRVRFVHALTREALYEGVLPPRRRIWHRQVAEHLAAAAHPDPDAVALHFQQAGDPRAATWLARAAERAQRAYAWHTAAERFRAAAAHLDGVSGQERKHRELLFRMAYLVRFSDPVSGIAALDEVERLAARAGDTVQAAEVRYFRGIHLCYADRYRLGLAEQASGIETLETIGPDTAQTPEGFRRWYANVITTTVESDQTGEQLIADRLHAAGYDSRRCVYPWFCASGGQLATAVAVGERFVGAFTGVSGAGGGIRVTAAFAHHGLGIAHAALGRPDRAHEEWTRARALFGEVDHFCLLAFTFLCELRDVALTYRAADLADRRRLAADAEAALGRAGGALQPGLSPRLAWLNCLVADGRWDEADQVLRDLPIPANCYLRREVTAAVATLARHRGDPDAAWNHIQPLFPDGPATEPSDIIHQEGLFLQRLAADLCLDRGDPEGACPWLEAHDRWLSWAGAVLGRAEGEAAWARWHLAAGDPARARARATAALELAAEPDQPLVRLAAHRLLGEIATAGRDHKEAEAHLTSALDLATACAVPFERAQTLLALAALRTAIGTSGAAAALIEEARAICVPLRSAPTLARADALAALLPTRSAAASYPAGLTQREVEVLRLLASHHMDKEIAAALFVSPRTVETHVANICGKLGVANRREAAAAATRLGLV
jgi:DNA-binding NarL/FixJ family response regulator